jgi:hypothetical protein
MNPLLFTRCLCGRQGDTLLNLTIGTASSSSSSSSSSSASGGGDDVVDASAVPSSTVSAFATTHAAGSNVDLRGLQIFVTNFSPMKG